ncbi:GntP family permease [Robertkochia flava]|uniref:GntP family permease n=1 Tax=Robertkochia flava TaxID=3447986 RepID=UPI001CCE1C86|nr:GntP family permease [Robertkochia marina]
MNVFLILFLVILLIIFMTVRFKLHPVFSLTGAALLSGLLLGFLPGALVEIITTGFGKTLSEIGLVIAFGTVIGVFLEKNGGMQLITSRLLRTLPEKWSPMAMNLVGFIISIPVFCDSGFIILSALNKALSRKTGIPLVVFAVCLSTGLYATHVFVPPTPGPLAAASVLGADIGLVMLLGFVVAIPVSFSGVVWGSILQKRHANAAAEQGKDFSEAHFEMNAKGSLTRVLLPLITPIVLIGAASVAGYPGNPLEDSALTAVLAFLGSPVIALFIGAILAMLSGMELSLKTRAQWISEALKDAGSIVLITGAGGAFGNVLRSADLGQIMEQELNLTGGGLLVAFVISAVLKSAQGSSTVAIITTAAIISPLMMQFGLEGSTDTALTVLAIGAGALTVSHVNDSYFWVVSQFSDLSVKQALGSHTLATLFQGITGILVILAMKMLLG